jgi:hypothetical protein
MICVVSKVGEMELYLIFPLCPQNGCPPKVKDKKLILHLQDMAKPVVFKLQAMARE